MARHIRSALLYPSLAALFASALPALDVRAQLDPLSLESAAPAEKVETSSTAKVFVEGSVGNASQRYLPGSLDTRRASFDLS